MTSFKVSEIGKMIFLNTFKAFVEGPSWPSFSRTAIEELEMYEALKEMNQ